jgi:hypothetical protein
LTDRTDLFKNSNLVLGGKEIVTNLYSSLGGQTEREREREREPGHVQGFIRVTTRETAILKWPIETMYTKF